MAGFDVAQQLALRRGARSARLVGRGIEFLFYVAEGGPSREGYRVPAAVQYDTVNNPQVAAHTLQRQEMWLSQWAGEHGLPIASIHDLVDVDGWPILVLDVVDDDGCAVNSEELGAVAAHLHRLPPPEVATVAQEGLEVGERIAGRLRHRYHVLSQTQSLPAWEALQDAHARLSEDCAPAVITHMDLRRQNLRCVAGVPQALFDWSNALHAPAALELARVCEYAAIADNGVDFESFLKGYRRAGGVVGPESATTLLYRLDTAVMLANVFDSVAPDAGLRALFVGRVHELVEAVAGCR